MKNWHQCFYSLLIDFFWFLLKQLIMQLTLLLPIKILNIILGIYNVPPQAMPPSLTASGTSGKPGWLFLFFSCPSGRRNAN